MDNLFIYELNTNILFIDSVLQQNLDQAQFFFKLDQYIQQNNIICTQELDQNFACKFQQCARSLAIEWEPIARCAKADEGKNLLAQMGEATHKLHPPVSFIPTIEVNKVYAHKQHLLLIRIYFHLANFLSCNFRIWATRLHF